MTQAGVHEAAIRWLVSLGHPGGSRCYSSGPAPRAACVISSASALAHVRLGVAVTQTEALQELVADARGRELQLFYFTAGTYAETALAYAERLGIALFTYDSVGIVCHANAAAMTVILAAPDVESPPEGPDALHAGAPTGARRILSAGQEPDLPVWALAAWKARRADPPGPALLAYLPLGVVLLLGLVTLSVLRAWQAGAAPTMRLATFVVAGIVFHAFCAWGVWRVARWREQRRQYRLHTMQACRLPRRARALVDTAMQLSGRGVPSDREAFVLLRNEVIERSRVDPFTAGVLVWEVTIGDARPADREEWLGAPPR